jgi:four helix bundle protein
MVLVVAAGIVNCFCLRIMNEKPPIKSYKDLEVYKNSYDACLRVAREIIPKLPESEKFDLKDQLSRSSKAVPRLIAEGYAKKHQKFGFQKYLDDAMAECNETIVGLEQCRDIYGVGPSICSELVTIYDITARQLFNLAKAWDNFKLNARLTKPFNNTGRHNQNCNHDQ